MSWVKIATACVVTAGLGSSLPAAGQDSPPDADAASEFAFEVADTDGDGLVSEGEMARDAAAAFSALDADQSGTLTPDELAPPADAEWFAEVDADGDGELTFTEVMDQKLEAFEDADRDDDGGMSYTEMVETLAVEQGGAQ